MGGLLIAAAVGYGIGQVVQMNYKPPKIDMPAAQITELREQTSSEGNPQPVIYGVARPIGGNLIWQTPAEKKYWKEKIGRVKVKKSLPSGKNKYEDIYQEHEDIVRSYAIRICRGPEVTVLRVWKNGKLVYDARGTAWGIENNETFLRNVTFYDGAWDQMPDPHMEAKIGYGQVPAYRGLAYMVVAEDNLTDYRGAMPQYTFEVGRSPGPILTTKMYDPVWNDGSTMSAGSVVGTRADVEWVEIDVGKENTTASVPVFSLTFESTLNEIEGLENTTASVPVFSLTFEENLIDYDGGVENTTASVPVFELTFEEK